MARVKPQLNRLYFIDREIRDRKYPNCSSLAAAWEVNSKTIQRDIDYLRTMHDAPIVYDAANRGYYYSEDNFRLPAISLNDSDLFAVFIAGKALQQYANTPLYHRLQSVFSRIEESLPDRVTVRTTGLDSRFSFFAEPASVVDPMVWELLFTALRANLTIMINYRKPGNDEGGERKVDPYHVVVYQGGWYVIAHCHQRQALRTFALSRMEKVVITDDSFPPPDEEELAEMVKADFAVPWQGDGHRVELEFSARMAPFIQERQWHRDQRLRLLADGGLNLSFPAGNLEQVKRWVLAWGAGVRVMAPKSLVDMVREELNQALVNY